MKNKRTKIEDKETFVFAATTSKRFICGEDTIELEIMYTEQTLCWRLTVNGVCSEPYFNFRGILVWDDYGVATDYFAPQIQEFIPFKIEYATEAR